jgi:hypothetical protein
MKSLLFFILILFSQKSIAAITHSIQVGIGLNSALSARYIPGLTAGIDFGDWSLSGTSTGVQTTAYYQALYSLGVYKTWNIGNFFWGDLIGGFGAGFGYNEIGYLTEKKSEIFFGPAFKITWEVASPIVFAFEAIYGLGDATAALPPMFHDVIMFSLGMRL